jgi:hypothetical protein
MRCPEDDLDDELRRPHLVTSHLDDRPDLAMAARRRMPVLLAG